MLALTHSSMGLFISFPSSSPASCFLILLKCIGSQIISFLSWSSINSMTLSWVHSISQLPKRSRNRTTLQIHATLQDRSIRNGKKGRRADGGDVSRCVQTCWGCNRIIPLMWRPNTDSTPNKSITLLRNQLLIHHEFTSPVHTVTIQCYGTR